ncbi:uncharacterized protein BYT42DRAFT_577975 [Radiomyces spectabilis]|uniref:uncharacterized protein n=1 Tax=Radiomyces spectabilis TaxID=64574 RepID=UPI00221F0CDF|nr:uncharacterized protein BYT42DRAFT_577975 [Radiomyces spectabilis]KAI8372781.1 hypothetical protein BYT42DRAFT_577975 [Radiomyces spectabilis]
MHATCIRLLSETIVTSSRCNDRLCVWNRKGQWLGTLEVGGPLHQLVVCPSEQVMMASMCHGAIRVWDFTRQGRPSHDPRRWSQGGSGRGEAGVHHQDTRRGILWIRQEDHQLDYMW